MNKLFSSCYDLGTTVVLHLYHMHNTVFPHCAYLLTVFGNVQDSLWSF